MIQDKIFKSKSLVDAQLWVFNGLSVVSLAFYFSLFSAGNPENFSISLQLATVLFGISLATNAPLAFLILISDKDPEFLDMLNRSQYFEWVPVVAMCSTGFAVISLVAFYSWLALIVVIATISVTGYLFYRTIQNESAQHKSEMCELELEKMNLMSEILKNNQEKNSSEE